MGRLENLGLACAISIGAIGGIAAFAENIQASQDYHQAEQAYNSGDTQTGDFYSARAGEFTSGSRLAEEVFVMGALSSAAFVVGRRRIGISPTAPNK